LKTTAFISTWCSSGWHWPSLHGFSTVACGGGRREMLPRSFPSSSSWRNHQGNRNRQSLTSRLNRCGTMTANQRTKTMTTICAQQSDSGRYACQKANASVFSFTPQIARSNYKVMFTKRDKSGATTFKSRCSRTVVCYRFYRVEALPLDFTRFSRLANSSPMAAQHPGDGRTVAAAMPPNVRQDGSQGLPCAGLGRAMSAPETCATTRNLAAQQPRQHLTSSSSDSRYQPLTVTSNNHEHTNHTNARP